MRPGLAIAWIWGVWLVSWMIAAAWTDRSSKRVGLRQELGYLLVQGVGIFVVVLSGQRRWRFDPQLWDVGVAGGWAGGFVCVVACACAAAAATSASKQIAETWKIRRMYDSGRYRM